MLFWKCFFGNAFLENAFLGNAFGGNAFGGNAFLNYLSLAPTFFFENRGGESTRKSKIIGRKTHYTDRIKKGEDKEHILCLLLFFTFDLH